MKTQAELYSSTDLYNSASDNQTPEFSPDATGNERPEDHFELKPDSFVKISDVEKVISENFNPRWIHTRKLIEAIYALHDGEQVVNASRAAGALRYVLARVIESNDAKLEAKCMAYSVGLTFKGNTATEIAVEHGISKQAVSKRIREFQEAHGISSSLGNKRVGSRETYRNGNSRRNAI